MDVVKMPDNSTFADSGGGRGRFVFKPDPSQVGVDTAIFICFDDETPALSGVINVEITVVSSNLPPEILSIGPQTVMEGDTLEFNIYATDPDGPSLSLYTSELPSNAVFVDSGNGVGTFTYMPDYLQSGLISIKFYATDGIEVVFENVLIQTYDNPQPPIITVPDTTMTITEGDTLIFAISAIDPDSTIPAFVLDTVGGLPLNASLVDAGNGTAVFEFKPVYVQSGTYNFAFIAFDETELADTGVVTVIVNDAGNQPPVFTHFEVSSVGHDFTDTLDIAELDFLEFTIFSTDADSIIPVLTASGVPGGATFSDSGDYSGTFTWLTTYADSGVHTITFYAIDGADPLVADTAEITIVIHNQNRPPAIIYLYLDGADWFTPYHDEITEGQTRVYGVQMLDPDSIPPLLRVSGLDHGADSLLPLWDNAVVVDNGDNWGTITFTPDYFQSRDPYYWFRVFAKDAEDTTLYIQKDFSVTVTNNPQAPVLDPIPTPISVTEGDSIDLVISYSDADLPPGPTLVLTYNPQPDNTYLTQIDPYSSQFSFYTWFDQSGTYEIRFQVMDDTYRIDTQTVVIEVLEAGPQAPILFVPFAPSDTVNLGSSFYERIWAIDPESEPITLSAENIPTNATFVDSGNGAGSFFFGPDETQGDMTYDVLFIADDGTLADTVTVEFYVQSFICGDVNGSGGVDVDDIVYLVDYIFTGGPAPDPLVSGDVNRTDCPLVVVDIDDVTHLVAYIFSGGDPPNCECP